MNDPIDLADAVAATINSAVANPPSGDPLPWDGVTAAVDLFPLLGRGVDLLSPRVLVAPVSQSSEPNSRGASMVTPAIAIVPTVVCPISGDDPDREWIARFVRLVAWIDRVLRRGSPPAGHTLAGVEIEPIYDPETLQSDTILRGLITARYRRAERD